MKPSVKIIMASKKKVRARKVISRANSRPTEKYPSVKMGRMLHCDSVLEEEGFTLFDVAKKVKSIHEQPATLYFEIAGIQHKHYPDALIKTDEGKYFVEIKYSDEAEQSDVKARTDYLMEEIPYCGYHYVLLTEKTIEQEPRLSNARYLVRNGRKKVDLVELEIFRRKYQKQGYVMWGEVLSEKVAPLNREKICRLILDGVLDIPMNEEWTDQTRLTLCRK